MLVYLSCSLYVPSECGLVSDQTCYLARSLLSFPVCVSFTERVKQISICLITFCVVGLQYLNRLRLHHSLEATFAVTDYIHQ